MVQRYNQYQSPSTPGVQHDSINLLVECMLINKFGFIHEYPWRKGQPHHKWWSEQVKVLKRITNTLQIGPRQLCWYVRRYRVESITYQDFGLLRWKIRKYFKYGSLDRVSFFYKKLQEANAAKNSSYVNDTKGFVSKQGSKKKKGLMDLMKELESSNGQG